MIALFTRKGSRRRPRGPGSRAGFTLTELMVSATLTSMLILTSLHLFVQQRLLLKSSEIVSETRQNIRTAMDMIGRDMRMAGYGLFINASELPLWVDWVEDLSGNPIAMDSNPKIVEGNNGASDKVWVAAAFDTWAASTAQAAAKGTTTLVLQSGEGARFNATTRKLILVGKVETARILSVVGDTLTISTDPTGSLGLYFDHPARESVELISVRGYQTHSQDVYNYPYQPYLTRDDCMGDTFTYYWQRMVASGIVDVQLTRTNDVVDMAVTGRATVPDRFYANGGSDDKYRVITLESSVLLRNKT